MENTTYRLLIERQELLRVIEANTNLNELNHESYCKVIEAITKFHFAAIEEKTNEHIKGFNKGIEQARDIYKPKNY